MYPIRLKTNHILQTPKEKRAERLKAKYGLTVEAYAALLESQKFSCKICGNYPEKRWLAVDHDHKTGRIRGLLCNNCNRLLGCAKDDTVILLKAIQYIKGNL